MRVEEILTEAQQAIPYDAYGYWIMPDGEVVPTAVAAHVESALRQLGLDDSELDDDYEGEKNFSIRREAIGEGAIRVVVAGNEVGIDFEDPTEEALRSLMEVLKVYKDFQRFEFDVENKQFDSYRKAMAYTRQWIG